MGAKSPRCSIQRCGKARKVDTYCGSHAVKECDRLFSILIRNRDGHCVRCGSEFGMQCAHVVSRRYRATRWDPANAVCLCYKCHHWQGNWPLEGDEFFDQHFGGRHVEIMRRTALAADPPDMEETLYYLRKAVAA